MKVISMCLWKRLDIAKNVVRDLSHCDGIKDYTLLIYVDGDGHPEMAKWAGTIGCCAKQVFKAGGHVGCNESTRRILTKAFALSDYVIHVEEDVNLAKDALRYFEWARQFQSNPTVFTVGAWRHPRGYLLEHGPFPMGREIEKKAAKSPFFNCWGWATWRDRFDLMLQNWTTEDDQTRSWDRAVSDLRRKLGRWEIVPLVSRAINTGYGGIHRDNADLSYWAGSTGFVFPREYQLVDRAE